jgi:hypothetical protein
MANEELEAKFKQVAAALHETLRPLGYVKRRHTFRRFVDGNAAVIECQRSQSSNSSEIKFTLNAGVVSGRLLEDWDPPIAQAGTSSAHLCSRIGFFMSERYDKWWILDNSTDAAPVIDEIRFALNERVLETPKTQGLSGQTLSVP